MIKNLLTSSIAAVLRYSLPAETQVCPALDRQRSAWPPVTLRDWIASSLPARSDLPFHRRIPTGVSDARPLQRARRDFIATLADIRSAQAADLVRRIHVARSVRELWFLRTEVFHLVARHRDQAQAHSALATLAVHFPRLAARARVGRTH